MGKEKNKQLFNDHSELQHEEFSDGTGLDWYNMPYRNYDPQVGVFHNIDPMPSDMISPYSYATDNPLMFEDPSGAESLGDFLGNAWKNWGNSDYYGGTWTADGNDDDNGDPSGTNYDFSSENDAFLFGSNQMGDEGWWGGGNGTFAASDAAATAAYNAATGEHLLQEETIIANDPASWATARNNIYNEVQQSLDEISNGGGEEGLNNLSSGNNNYSSYDILANIAGSAGFSLNLLEGYINGAQRIGNAFGPAKDQILDLRGLPIIEAGSNLLGFVAVGSASINIYQNGLNLDNETDLLMGIASFIPGPDVIAGLYFISNVIVKGSTGHTIPYYYLKYTQKVDWNAASSVYVF